MSAREALRALLESLPACEALCPDGIFTEAGAGARGGALCLEEELGRTEDILGQVTRRLRWRLWLPRCAGGEEARAALAAGCERLRAEALRAGTSFDAVEMTPLRLARLDGGTGAFYVDITTTSTERKEANG